MTPPAATEPTPRSRDQDVMRTAKPTRFDSLADRLPGLGRDPAAVRKRIETMEQVLERMFVIPGIKQPIGLDVMLDMLPIAGDLVGAALGAWLVWEARNLGMSKWQMARMLGNVGFDAVLGAIPFLGGHYDLVRCVQGSLPIPMRRRPHSKAARQDVRNIILFDVRIGRACSCGGTGMDRAWPNCAGPAGAARNNSNR